MRNEKWLLYAECRGKHPNTWFPEQTDHQTAAIAKEICLSCPVAARCLLTAVNENEGRGIRGGLGEDQRRRLRRNWRKMSSGEWAGGLPRFNKLCVLTIDMLQQGIEPPWIAQRNTDGATCGRIATWNRGCRCASCLAASAAVSYMRKVLPEAECLAIMPEAKPAILLILKSYTPKTETVDLDAEAAENEAQYAKVVAA